MEKSDGMVIYKTKVAFVALCEITRIILFFKIVTDMEVRKLCVFSLLCQRNINYYILCKVFDLLLY